jgi:Ca2+/H+ antiporter
MSDSNETDLKDTGSINADKSEGKDIKNDYEMPNTKPVPIIICLFASFIICLVTILQKKSFNTFVLRFALTAIIFYILGIIVRVVMDRSFKVDKEETEKTLKESETSDEESENKAVQDEESAKS